MQRGHTPPQPWLISPLGFRNPSPRESYETENHSAANSTSRGLAAPSRAAFQDQKPI